MPVLLPSTTARPLTDQQSMLLRMGFWLGLLLILPICALFALDGLLWLRCTTVVTGNGALENGLEWRIERRQCAGSKAPYFDVLIGLPGKAANPALIALGEPMPVSVVMSGETPVVTLSGPLPGSTQPGIVPLKMRKSGSPAVRIDLEQLKLKASQQFGGKS